MHLFETKSGVADSLSAPVWDENRSIHFRLSLAKAPWCIHAPKAVFSRHSVAWHLVTDVVIRTHFFKEAAPWRFRPSSTLTLYLNTPAKPRRHRPATIITRDAQAADDITWKLEIIYKSRLVFFSALAHSRQTLSRGLRLAKLQRFWSASKSQTSYAIMGINSLVLTNIRTKLKSWILAVDHSA